MEIISEKYDDDYHAYEKYRQRKFPLELWNVYIENIAAACNYCFLINQQFCEISVYGKDSAVIILDYIAVYNYTFIYVVDKTVVVMTNTMLHMKCENN